MTSATLERPHRVPAMSRFFLSAAEREKVVKLAKAGVSTTDIALRMGKSRGQVCAVIRGMR